MPTVTAEDSILRCSELLSLSLLLEGRENKLANEGCLGHVDGLTINEGGSEIEEQLVTVEALDGNDNKLLTIDECMGDEEKE